MTDEQPPEIPFAELQNGISVKEHNRDLEFYKVQGFEIDELSEIGNLKALDLGMFTTFLSLSASSLFATITTTPNTPEIAATLNLGIAVFAVLAVFFGWRLYLQSKKKNKIVNRLKHRATP